MRNLRFPFQRIFNYIKETIIYEFHWFGPGSKTIQILESKKNRTILASKHLAVELITFFVICALLVVLIFLSSKCSKNEEVIDDNEEDEMDDEHNSLTPVINEAGFNENILRHDCGDSMQIQRLEEFVTININSQNANNFIGGQNFLDTLGNPSSETSAVSVIETTSFSPMVQEVQEKISVQSQLDLTNNNESVHQSAAINEQEWLVRRTRSGQIYGKYKF